MTQVRTSVDRTHLDSFSRLTNERGCVIPARVQGVTVQFFWAQSDSALRISSSLVAQN